MTTATEAHALLVRALQAPRMAPKMGQGLRKNAGAVLKEHWPEMTEAQKGDLLLRAALKVPSTLGGVIPQPRSARGRR